MLTIVLASLAIAIVIVLASYAGLQVWRLRHHRQQLSAEQATQRVQQQRSAESAKKNIIILLRVIEQGQISLTEAAIRISAYRMALAEPFAELPAFSVFEQLANETAHIPILDRWQALSRSEQSEYDRQRTVIEQRHSPSISSNAQLLLITLQAED